MLFRPSSALILTLIGMMSPESAQISVETTPFPKAPVPEVSAPALPSDIVQERVADLHRSILQRTQTVTERADVPPVQPATKVANINLVALDLTYQRTPKAAVGEGPRALVESLANAYQPKASGEQGVPVDWLPRETRKVLGEQGPRDVVLIGVTDAFAWYVWAEDEAAWIGRVDLGQPAYLSAGSLPAEGPFQVVGPQTLTVAPGQPLVITDESGNPVPLRSR